MNSQDMNELLLKKFPELKDKFLEETSWQDGINTGSFVVYEDVFIPFLEINVEMKNENMIERIYSFIEELCNYEDDYVSNLLYVAILEHISAYDDPTIFTKYLKPKSLNIYKKNYD